MNKFIGLIEAAGSRFQHDYGKLIRMKHYSASWKNEKTKRYISSSTTGILCDGHCIYYNMDTMSFSEFRDEIIKREHNSYMFTEITTEKRLQNVSINTGAYSYKLGSITITDGVMRFVFVNDIIEPSEEPDCIVLFYRSDVLISGYILSPVSVHLYV